MKTIQASPLGLTPLSLFLAKDIRLDRGVTVARVTHTPGGFTVVARDAGKKAQGQIALNFTESAHRTHRMDDHRRWRRRDPREARRFRGLDA